MEWRRSKVHYHRVKHGACFVQTMQFPHNQTGKIHVTVNMFSIMGGLHQDFSAASSIMSCAEFLVHDERNLGTGWWEQKFLHITTRHCLDYTLCISDYLPNSMESKCMWSQPDQCWQLIILLTVVVKSWPINCTLLYTCCCLFVCLLGFKGTCCCTFQSSIRWG